MKMNVYRLYSRYQPYSMLPSLEKGIHGRLAASGMKQPSSLVNAAKAQHVVSPAPRKRCAEGAKKRLKSQSPTQVARQYDCAEQLKTKNGYLRKPLAEIANVADTSYTNVSNKKCTFAEKSKTPVICAAKFDSL